MEAGRDRLNGQSGCRPCVITLLQRFASHPSLAKKTGQEYKSVKEPHVEVDTCAGPNQDRFSACEQAVMQRKRSARARHASLQKVLHLWRAQVVARVSDLAENAKFALEFLVKAHDGGHVAAAIAVVWRAPNRHKVLVLKVVLEAFLNELVSAANQLKAVDVAKLVCNPGPKQIARTAGRQAPGLDVFWVRPHQIAKRPFLRDLL
mmetsp:Transcript_5196/g.16696  ORF Transcript_5196/g.16696 Transcript_5196/m.16696 type:complete len:205 (+) Transcript_5196:59-673(+)